MVCKMVNEVQQQGNYWIANNFIYGWLLIPAIALGEIIKRDCKDGYKGLNKKAYKKVILGTIIVWLISIPFWNLIFSKLMAVENTSDIFHIVICLLPFLHSISRNCLYRQYILWIRKNSIYNEYICYC